MGEFVRLEVEDGVGTIRLERPPMNALSAQVQEEIRAAAAGGRRPRRREGRRRLRRPQGLRGRRRRQGDGRLDLPADGRPLGRAAVVVHRRRADPQADHRRDHRLRARRRAASSRCAATCASRATTPSSASPRSCWASSRAPAAPSASRGSSDLRGPRSSSSPGRFVDAEEALRIGLVDRVVAPDDVYTESLALAKRLAAGPAYALRAAKEAIDRGLEVDLETGLEIERVQFAALFATEDRAIGMASFIEHGPGKAEFVRAADRRRRCPRSVAGRGLLLQRLEHLRVLRVEPAHEVLVGDEADVGEVDVRVDDEPGQRVLVGAARPRVEVVADEERRAVAALDRGQRLHERLVGRGLDLRALRGRRRDLGVVLHEEQVVVHRQVGLAVADDVDALEREAPHVVVGELARPYQRARARGVVGEPVLLEHGVHLVALARQARACGRPARRWRRTAACRLGSVLVLISAHWSRNVLRLRELGGPVGLVPGADTLRVAEVAEEVRADLVAALVRRRQVLDATGDERRVARTDRRGAGRLARRLVEETLAVRDEAEPGEEEREPRVGVLAELQVVLPQRVEAGAVEGDDDELRRASRRASAW